jgi:hypothetical protein
MSNQLSLVKIIIVLLILLTAYSLQQDGNYMYHIIYRLGIHYIAHCAIFLCPEQLHELCCYSHFPARLYGQNVFVMFAELYVCCHSAAPVLFFGS